MARITPEGYSRLYAGPDRGSRVIALIQQDTHCPLLIDTETWVKIAFEAVEGWIEKDKIELLAPPSAPPPLAAAEPDVASPRRETTPAPLPAEPPPSRAPATDTRQEEPREPQRPSGIWDRVTRTLAPSPSRELQPSVAETDDTPLGPRVLERRAEEVFLVRILSPSLPVLAAIAPQAPIVGMARSSERYRVINQTTSWIQIAFGDTIGWIERSRVELIDPSRPRGGFSRPLIALLSVLALLVLTGAVLIVRGLRDRGKKRNPHQKTALMVARSPKNIVMTLTNTTSTLTACFNEVGFAVVRVPDTGSAAMRIAHMLPDIIVVDWQLSSAIAADIETLLVSRTSMTNIPVLYYNVPDPGAGTHRSQLSNVHYAGCSLSDHDIFRFVTPLVVTGERRHTINRSVRHSALEGEISDGNIAAVLQLLEIGGKSGCLLVHFQRPYGMIYLNEGIIIWAAARELRAEAAVHEVLDLASGYFRFISGKIPPEPNCSIRVMGLLMERAKNSDEASRH